MNPALELTETLRRFAERCRSMRWFGPLFHVGVCQDIAADIEREQAQRREVAAQAQNCDLEALAEIEKATARDSDGGSTITPRELRRIRPLIVESAMKDEQLTK